jgi:hypothetical protein
MSSALLAILDQAAIASAGPAAFTPVICSRNGNGSEKFGAGRPAILEVLRIQDGAFDATSGTVPILNGTIGVWGADLPHPDTGAPSKVQRFPGSAGATGRTVFTTTTDMPYVALSANNYIVLKNGVPLPPIAGVTGFAITDGTLKTIITLGTAAAVNDKIDVYFVVPVEVLADGGHTVEKTQISRCYDAMWVIPAYTSSKLSRTLVVLRPAA